MENNIWRIVLENYQNDHITCYFESYEIARKNFNRLWELNKDMLEFEVDCSKDIMSWFDPHYNEYSTYVYLLPGGPKIYNEIIF